MNYFEEEITVTAIDKDYFKQCVGRVPKDLSEFQKFVNLIEKGNHSSIDWDFINNHAAQEIKS